MATKKSTKPHGNLKDLTGQRFERLVVLGILERRSSKIVWECRCDCGNISGVFGPNLQRGFSKSCGCYKLEHNSTHGRCKTPEYKAWGKVKERCFNPQHPEYPNYGGRGISMCNEWLNDFSAFFAHIGPRPKGTSLDRIDNNLGYQPGNVRWADSHQQCNNQRRNVRVTHNGETLTLGEWSDKTGIPYPTLWFRHNGVIKTPFLSPPRGKGWRKSKS